MHKTRILLLTLLTLLMSSLSQADEMRTALFAEADDALRAAALVDANLLAPQSYSKAAEAYRSASTRLEKGQSIDRIKKDLEEAVMHLRAALDATRLAEVTLIDGIAARKDAVTSQTEEFAPKQWQEAEVAFAEAASKLEGGNVNSAQRGVEKAQKLYREAELIAIKTNYLASTRNLIEQAKENDARKYAPDTLAKAESLLEQAEKAFTENRYDIDEPRALAREAKYEAQHANRIAGLVEPVSRRKTSLEALVLELEKPIVKIAGSLDQLPALDGSVEDVSEPILEKISELQGESYDLGQQLNNVATLETAVTELESRLGMQSERLEIQEQQRQQFETVERMFTPEEAVVLKHGSNVLIRMSGLNFKSGSANIGTDYFAILQKVQRAMGVFPAAPVIIEGHTDSFGGDEANVKLSQVRAEAVRTYLLANMSGREGKSIDAQGFGETKPIANNETPEGRTKNRRIDLVIEL